MFNNLMLFRLGSWPESLTDLQDALTQELFTPCTATQQKTTGWLPPRGLEHGEMAESINGQWIAKFVIETKAVPADAIKRHVEEIAQQLEATTGRAPGKRERKDMRDDALQALLPNAFPKQSSNWVWFDPETRLLALEASSPARADEITTSLTRVAGAGFTLRLIQTNTTPQALLSSWLLSEDAADLPAEFSLGRECELKGTGDEPAMIRFKRHDLFTPEVRQHLLDGMQPIAVALNWEDRVRFTLTETMVLKKVSFDDSVFSDVADDDERFDTDVTIQTAELQQMIEQLLAALGGEQSHFASTAAPAVAAAPAAATTAPEAGAAPTAAPAAGDELLDPPF